ncbi:MAG: flagellar biosynthetic protein FliO, partial [Candidatus Competibacteraceae bacterium]|nr:flagellar biosynthetic protein FliO [Candidatus Competibacteraceae bacterium]
GLLQMVLGLVLVLGFILGAAWLVRRFTPLRGGDGAIRLRGGLSLGTRERLVLVEVEGVRLLVGVSPGRLQTLHIFDGRAVPREAQENFQAQLLAGGPRGHDAH